MNKKSLTRGTLTILTLMLSSLACAQPVLTLEPIGRYTTGLANIAGGVSSGETAALRGERLYVTNANDVSLDIVDVSDPLAPTLVRRVDLREHGSAVTSVDVSSKNLVAVAITAFRKTDPGTVVFMTPAGQIIRTARVGSGPDMVVFTPQGDRLLVANEGEPDCYGPGCTDPEGSVSVIDVIPMKPSLPVHTIDFGGITLPAGVRIFGPNATPAQDLEPEYITVSNDGLTAWVALQENNAIAKLDLKMLTVSAMYPLGYKDHAVAGQGLDASDRDGPSNGPAINIRPWNSVLGMYQPDGIAQFQVGGQTYLITANEGDARDYPGFAEEVRARDAGTSVADASSNTRLGRLTITSAPPGGDKSKLYVFGARSFSIWNAATGTQVWDSGDQLEQMTAAALPTRFNSNNAANDFDSRSDNKGPEPEAVAIGELGGRLYAFIGLERVGGVVVYDITVPAAPVFQQYFATRDFSTGAVGPDSGPEIIRFIRAELSPTGQPMLVVSNELTGTVNLLAFKVGTAQ